MVEYYQMTQTMLSDQEYERAVHSLKAIDDNHSKYVLSLDRFLKPLEGGLIHMNLVD